MPESEAGFHSAVIDLAALRGWQVMHVRRSVTGERGQWATTTSVAGWPDLVLWRPGQLLFRELKTDRGQLTADQAEVLRSLAAAGADVGVWRPRDWDNVAERLSRDG